MEQRTWSTRQRPEHEQFAYWREVVCAAFVDLRPERPGHGPFDGAVRTTALADVTAARVASEAQRVRRSEREIASSPAAQFYVLVQLHGTGAVHAGGRTAVLRPGDLAMVDILRPYELAFDGPFAQLCFGVPHERLAVRLASPEAATAVRVPASTGVGALVSGCLRAVGVNPIAGDLDPAAADALAEHLAGLVAVALRGLAPPAAGTRGRAALLQAVLDDAERHLGDPALAPAAVAARVGISTRYLHKLFAERGETFGRWVAERRLAAARRDLADPAFGHWRVAELALRHGFADPSHFGRAFRARYGTTPGAFRTAAR
jgi:AraC-like DNA-binding protein